MGGAVVARHPQLLAGRGGVGDSSKVQITRCAGADACNVNARAIRAGDGAHTPIVRVSRTVVGGYPVRAERIRQTVGDPGRNNFSGRENDGWAAVKPGSVTTIKLNFL